MWILIKWALIDLPPWLLQALIPRGENLLAGYFMYRVYCSEMGGVYPVEQSARQRRPRFHAPSNQWYISAVEIPLGLLKTWGNRMYKKSLWIYLLFRYICTLEGHFGILQHRIEIDQKPNSMLAPLKFTVCPRPCRLAHLIVAINTPSWLFRI